MDIDFGRTAADYARHRAGFPETFFDRLFRDDIARDTDRVLDLGTAQALSLAVSRGADAASRVSIHRAPCLRKPSASPGRRASASVL